MALERSERLCSCERRARSGIALRFCFSFSDRPPVLAFFSPLAAPNLPRPCSGGRRRRRIAEGDGRRGEALCALRVCAKQAAGAAAAAVQRGGRWAPRKHSGERRGAADAPRGRS